jgi:hypothetical protein
VTGELGPWQPLAPGAVATLFAEFGVPWWIAGGWAIDLFLGRPTRAHGDIDVLVLRRDQLAVQRVLAGWDLHAADPPGKLRPWRPGEVLPAEVHDVWCRRRPDAPWCLQLMLDVDDGDDWVFRRDRRVRRSVAGLGRTSADGIPYLAPEVQLLYKARPAPRPKDEADFAAALPLLPPERRAWLRDALDVCAPAHPWRRRLVMAAADVLALLGTLDGAGLPVWIGGGWGIDALIGEQTRDHDDLDLAFWAEDEARLLGVLGGLGLRLVEDQRPVRFVMRAEDGRAVDLHPVAFDRSGKGVQAGFDGAWFEYPADGFGRGRIGGEPVPCLTAAQQVRFHLGYAPGEKDRHDMALLAERLGVALPEAYGSG